MHSAETTEHSPETSEHFQAAYQLASATYLTLKLSFLPKAAVVSLSFLSEHQGEIRGHALLKHLPNVETRFYCPLLSLTVPELLAGAAQDTDNKPELRTARKSTSRKQLQFAPLQLGHIPAKPSRTPSNGADAVPLSPGRSKSLGSVVDRSLLKDAADAELAVNKDRPHSAQLQKTVLHWALCCIAYGIATDRTCRFVACLVLCMEGF